MCCGTKLFREDYEVQQRRECRVAMPSGSAMVLLFTSDGAEPKSGYEWQRDR
jgi:hypothetical protein